jgi:Ca-activated chloride channel homolog
MANPVLSEKTVTQSIGTVDRTDAMTIQGAVNKAIVLLLLVIASSIWVFSIAYAQEEQDDRSLSPYFFVQSEDPRTDRLPLKSTSAAVTISGVIADVAVTQVYKNEGKRPIEAIYVFPASTRAAVHAMKMTIGKRVIVAKIKTRDEARLEYEQAKQEGKSASLLEQQRPNIFQMNVANIMPNDEIKVEMSYTELIVPADKVYEFVYPAVVGPRYSNQKAESSSSDKWVKNPYLHQGEKPAYAFDLSVTLNAGLPIQDISSPSHKVAVTYDGPASAKVALDGSEKSGGNRDYILKYRLAGDRIESGLLLSKGEKENFFLLMLQPPKRVALSQIPPREYIFIVDVSGSMNGFPLDISKKLLKDLIGGLRSTDLFNVVLFAGSSTVMSPKSVPATHDNINRAINVIDQQDGGGGTELLPALERALKLPGQENFSRTIVIATDGLITVKEEAFDLMRKNLGRANMFTFGIGSSVNRHLLEGMAHVGMGEPFIITRSEEAAAKADEFRKLIESPVLTSVKAKFKGFDVYDVEPKSIPDVLADRPITIFGKWRGELRGTIVLSGLSGNADYRETIAVSKAGAATGNKALQHLWARHRIMLLSDYNQLRHSDERVSEVTSLGLTYNLLTAYTSFVAVDNEIRNKGGRQATVSQPLPLPERNILASRGMPLLARVEETVTDAGIEIEKLHVTGGLSQEEVRRVIDQEKSSLAGCSLTGSVRLELSLNADGTVKSVAGTGECIRTLVAKWVFPQASGQMTKVSVELKMVRTVEEIDRYLDRYKAALYRLYNAELRKDHTLGGKLTLRITIEPGGEVSACTVQSTELDSPELVNQILERVKKFNFGPKEGVSSTTILYPIGFRSHQ